MSSRYRASDKLPVMNSLFQRLDVAHVANYDCKVFQNVGCVSFIYNNHKWNFSKVSVASYSSVNL